MASADAEAAAEGSTDNTAADCEAAGVAEEGHCPLLDQDALEVQTARTLKDLAAVGVVAAAAAAVVAGQVEAPDVCFGSGRAYLGEAGGSHRSRTVASFGGGSSLLQECFGERREAAAAGQDSLAGGRLEPRGVADIPWGAAARGPVESRNTESGTRKMQPVPRWYRKCVMGRSAGPVGCARMQVEEELKGERGPKSIPE